MRADFSVQSFFGKHRASCPTSYQLGYSVLADYLNENRCTFTKLIISVMPGTTLVDGHITMGQNDVIIALRGLMVCWRTKKSVGHTAMGGPGSRGVYGRISDGCLI